MSPFQIVQGFNPKQPIDLLPIPLTFHISESAKSFANRLHDLHAEIRRKLATSNDQYKLSANTHRRFQSFEIGDYVMARIHLERYPKHAFKKLHARATGPFRIIKKLGPNAYLLELPSDMAISPVFNVKDLMPYRGTFEPSPLLSDDFAGTKPSQVPIPSLPAVSPLVDEIETIMDDQMVFTSEGPIRRYLVRWRGRSDEDATWISEDEFQQLNPALLETYQLSTSPEEMGHLVLVATIGEVQIEVGHLVLVVATGEVPMVVGSSILVVTIGLVSVKVIRLILVVTIGSISMEVGRFDLDGCHRSDLK
ncbi:uncharacterized protein LOC129311378 [Prosopis cineraria]|uniref:uncharacterized protein LOC129311378 n=1 Tax=Prosopis cineraria TaxID=364024 RepID=UPI0024103909|nr:uncharacterized protein LOC129311378 [Prosopis cineraria]